MDGVGTWLTYAEIAERTGATVHAARLRAVRKHWRRQLGNDGKARVLVPPGELEGVLEPPPKPPLEQEPERALESHPSTEVKLLERLASLQVELVEMARRAGAAEAAAEEIRLDRDRERERADRLTVEVTALAHQLAKAVEDATARVREHQEQVMEAGRAKAEAEVARAERDQAVERLNLNIDRLDQVQAEHHAELMAVREQMARAEHDRDHAAAELAAHLALPWWRRLFV